MVLYKIYLLGARWYKPYCFQQKRVTGHDGVIGARCAAQPCRATRATLSNIHGQMRLENALCEFCPMS